MWRILILDVFAANKLYLGPKNLFCISCVVVEQRKTLLLSLVVEKCFDQTNIGQWTNIFLICSQESFLYQCSLKNWWSRSHTDKTVLISLVVEHNVDPVSVFAEEIANLAKRELCLYDWSLNVSLIPGQKSHIVDAMSARFLVSIFVEELPFRL